MTITSKVLDRSAKIYVAGHLGMVGSALVRRLEADGYDNIIVRTRVELDLMDQARTAAFFEEQRFDYVFLAAALTGGIHANQTYRADFIYRNLMIEANVIHAAYSTGVKNLLFLGSSCIYPRDSAQPIHEESLLTGPLEQTNEPYAIAKIAGVKLCESYNRQYGTNYLCAMPTNLYGPNDNYDLQTGHVLPALIRKAHEAKVRGDNQMTVWGSGQPMREFMYVDDLADACVYLMENDVSEGLINIGTGTDVSISELAHTVMEIVGFDGKVVFDASKPDGTPRKLLSVERLSALGWQAETSLRDGIGMAYADYLKSLDR
ncbi:GDP-L-fucose synthase [Neorhizobium sp. BT27B]|uniref:GDP-L-fucose synthase family protein n=1 Tax=Neorhizobium sp. BT27B TaxID=3142625 RepID=UPI003D2D84D6